ncbi:MAG: efp [Chlamydiales bacterium]|jgi:elongation factor P|nr:efp [Chlamydiales bacterium]
MVSSNQVTPGMTLSISGKLYRVESAVKVTVPKGTPFIKLKLRSLDQQELIEKSFKLNQPVDEVSLVERSLEYLYPEEDGYLFLDIKSLDHVMIPKAVVGNKVHYLKEGTELQASFFGDTVYSMELPQFLELMVADTEGDSSVSLIAQNSKVAILETGARIEVPPFVEVGDIIKVDTRSDEYIQRV